MWHLLFYNVYKPDIINILKDGKITIDPVLSEMGYDYIKLHYLSSLLNDKNIKIYNNYNSENYILIGFNPKFLNNKKFIICDRYNTQKCKHKYQFVISHNNNKKPIDYKKINNFINSRISDNININMDFYIDHTRDKLKNYFRIDLQNNYSFIDKKLHDLKKVEKINNKIKEIEKLKNDDVINYEYTIYPWMKKSDIESKYEHSHEVVIDGTVDIKDINFIMITKNSTDEFKTELKKVCPDYIKIIEIEPNDFTKYTKRIQKIFEKNSEHIEL